MNAPTHTFAGVFIFLSFLTVECFPFTHNITTYLSARLHIRFQFATELLNANANKSIIQYYCLPIIYCYYQLANRVAALQQQLEMLHASQMTGKACMCVYLSRCWCVRWQHYISAFSTLQHNLIDDYFEASFQLSAA